MFHLLLSRTISFIAATLFAFGALSADLKTPDNDIILNVTGAIGNTNADGAAQFDLQMLQALPVTTFDTSTIWTDGVHKFTGVSLYDLLEAVAATGKRLEAIAINDYSVELPASDAVKGGPIIAYLLDGKTMSVRERGPLWIVYPFDQERNYRSEVIYARSIWQLKDIKVMD
tara:strand:+ start:2307 stop:2822 length:516 start_codon:yes stop_codon:yes gene_type:complete